MEERAKEYCLQDRNDEDHKQFAIVKKAISISPKVYIYKHYSILTLIYRSI